MSIKQKIKGLNANNIDKYSTGTLRNNLENRPSPIGRLHRNLRSTTNDQIPSGSESDDDDSITSQQREQARRTIACMNIAMNHEIHAATQKRMAQYLFDGGRTLLESLAPPDNITLQNIGDILRFAELNHRISEKIMNVFSNDIISEESTVLDDLFTNFNGTIEYIAELIYNDPIRDDDNYRTSPLETAQNMRPAELKTTIRQKVNAILSQADLTINQ